ncbi:hypothetical protein NDU88_007823 [Pleurodeles waltl]|uniref:Uncharacterized protein n=1 Tax=Pleurodeles waltl TaxID=8319 RepID=A0AAV7QSY8_PLEWA|nr:hypothetical protein NDU88_007823 [Pleurodeles waltl]
MLRQCGPRFASLAKLALPTSSSPRAGQMLKMERVSLGRTPRHVTLAGPCEGLWAYKGGRAGLSDGEAGTSGEAYGPLDPIGGKSQWVKGMGGTPGQRRGRGRPKQGRGARQFESQPGCSKEVCRGMEGQKQAAEGSVGHTGRDHMGNPPGQSRGTDWSTVDIEAKIQEQRQAVRK